MKKCYKQLSNKKCKIKLKVVSIEIGSKIEGVRQAIITNKVIRILIAVFSGAV